MLLYAAFLLREKRTKRSLVRVAAQIAVCLKVIRKIGKRMTEETRNEKYKRQTAENFESLGRFVQEFENLVSRIRRTCLFLMMPTNGGNQLLINIVLHHHALTAQPLFECMRALYGQKLEDTPNCPVDEISATKSILKQCATEMQELVNWRNTLLHATWYIGWTMESNTDFSEIIMQSIKSGPDGFKVRDDLPSDTTALNKITARCRDLANFISELHIAHQFLRSGKGVEPRVRFHFELHEGKWRKKLD